MTLWQKCNRNINQCIVNPQTKFFKKIAIIKNRGWTANHNVEAEQIEITYGIKTKLIIMDKNEWSESETFLLFSSSERRNASNWTLPLCPQAPTQAADGWFCRVTMASRRGGRGTPDPLGTTCTLPLPSASGRYCGGQEWHQFPVGMLLCAAEGVSPRLEAEGGGGGRSRVGFPWKLPLGHLLQSLSRCSCSSTSATSATVCLLLCPPPLPPRETAVCGEQQRPTE